MLTFGRKHLPASRDEGAHEVEWGRITAVGNDLKELKDALGASTYETKVCVILTSIWLFSSDKSKSILLNLDVFPRPEEHAINQLQGVRLKATISSVHLNQGKETNK